MLAADRSAPERSTPGHERPVPQFDLHEAERIVRRLAPALQAHGRWIESIHTRLICRTLVECRSLGDDGHLRSELGRWFVDESNEFIRRHPAYIAAVEHHREVCAKARKLCEAVADDLPISHADYHAFAASIGRLDRSLEALVKEVWDLLRYTDPLTGIATRYALLPRLREEHQRVQRTGHSCSVCMVDLDHFKRINDTWGHHAGDAVLEAVSAYLVQNLRRYDQVCRYGGEEFVLMLPNTEPEQAVPIVDRLRRGLGGLSIRFEDSVLRVTASFGIAPLLADQSIGVSIERADRAMYAAKRTGRDRVQMWQQAEDRQPLENGAASSAVSGS